MPNINPETMIEALAEANRASRTIPIEALHESQFLDSSAKLIREGELAGLGVQARGAEMASTKVARDAHVIEGINQKMIKELRDLRTVGSMVQAASPPRPGLEDLFHLFSSQDRVNLALLADKLMRNRTLVTAGRLNNMAGAMREVVATVLTDVVQEVESGMRDLYEVARGTRNLSPIDTAVHGAIQLPTRMKGGERSIKLGTDRFVGLGRVEPQRVSAAWREGPAVDIAGIIDIRIAIEVKGRTTAMGGIEQLRVLQSRGEKGYAQIGAQLWLVNYEPKKVIHLLVAPEGPALVRARSAAKELTTAGTKTRVVGIPTAVDDQLIELSRDYLNAAGKAF